MPEQKDYTQMGFWGPCAAWHKRPAVRPAFEDPKRLFFTKNRYNFLLCIGLGWLYLVPLKGGTRYNQQPAQPKNGIQQIIQPRYKIQPA